MFKKGFTFERLVEKHSNCPAGWVLQDGVCEELLEQKLVFWPLYAIPQLGSGQRLKL
jgi:hypothetical protein